MMNFDERDLMAFKNEPTSVTFTRCLKYSSACCRRGRVAWRLLWPFASVNRPSSCHRLALRSTTMFETIPRTSKSCSQLPFAGTAEAGHQVGMDHFRRADADGGFVLASDNPCL